VLGGITATGGGVSRDVLVSHVPAVLPVDIYASAALLGAAAVVAARRVRLWTPLAMTLGGVTCFVVRMLSVWRHWHLPTIGGSP
jgi:uncharacterized membrane protein YeiH